MGLTAVVVEVSDTQIYPESAFLIREQKWKYPLLVYVKLQSVPKKLSIKNIDSDLLSTLIKSVLYIQWLCKFCLICHLLILLV